MNRVNVLVSAAGAFAVAALLRSATLNAEPFKRIAEKTSGPVVMPWKSLHPDRAYHGQWLVAGDLDGDGLAEIVTARNDKQSVTTVLVMRLDGSVLWRWGKPDTGAQGIGYDVPVQIYDLDGDGRNEVYLSPKGYLLVLDGPAGKELRRLPLPKGLDVADCITFADLRGLGRARDIIIKDRYHQLWAYSDKWKLLWHWKPHEYRTCHHPTPIDVDGDGRDEVVAGYTMLDDDGKSLWTFTSKKTDLNRGHLDCCDLVATGRKPADFRLVLTCCGANCVALVDGTGKTLWEVTGHHFESADAGRICKDLPGKQIVVDIDHRPFGAGSVWLLDDRGRHVGTWITGYGRHHRLIDWDGDGLDEILIGQSRRLFNGRGECVSQFGPLGAFDGELGPQTGNDPGPLAVVGDVDGDGRLEVILHSTRTVHVYKSKQAAKVPGLAPGTGVNFTLY